MFGEEIIKPREMPGKTVGPRVNHPALFFLMCFIDTPSDAFFFTYR